MRSFGSGLCGLLLLATVPAAADQRAVTPASAQRVVDDSDRISLPGNVPALARPELERGRSNPSLAMERMILLLEPRPGAAARLEQLLAEQQDPASSRYHQWLTPEQFGAEFGLDDEHVKLVTGWLEAQGFTIEEVAPGRGWINFSGTVAQVENAFATEIHDYEVEGAIRQSNASDPSLPRGLVGLVHGVVSLNGFPSRPQHSSVRPISELDPAFTSGGHHYLAPADFATIYNVDSVYSMGIDGSGQTIAIVARTDIKLSDVQTFRSNFSLPANDPVFIHNGTDPGDRGGGEEFEAALDTEWSGAVAPHATIDVVISASTRTTDGVALSAQYVVSQNLAVAMSTSFGLCEARLGPSGLRFYNNVWAQAAAQGITAFVSSGDSGAAGCDAASGTRGFGQAVNGICSSSNDVCVGGTQFNDTANPSLFWASSNQPGTHSSALSYIPEVAWNESGTVAGGGHLWSSGGGASRIYTKPSWQSAPGVPADHKRDVPDISLSAALHDGYVVAVGGGLYAVGGTSASSPSFAGLMALVVQSKGGARQGNANPNLYQLATNQYAHGGPPVFHDVTSGNNTVPRLKGFACGPGYDEVTGLGSVDGAALVANWP
jgi:pseudomonalisin